MNFEVLAFYVDKNDNESKLADMLINWNGLLSLIKQLGENTVYTLQVSQCTH